MKFAQILELYQDGNEEAIQFLDPVLNTICRVLYNLLWIYNPTRIVIDSCKNQYSAIIVEYFKKFVEKRMDDAIPIHVQVRQARYDEYHMMRGCFYMIRNAWIEEITESVK